MHTRPVKKTNIANRSVSWGAVHTPDLYTTGLRRSEHRAMGGVAAVLVLCGYTSADAQLQLADNAATLQHCDGPSGAPPLVRCAVGSTRPCGAKNAADSALPAVAPTIRPKCPPLCIRARGHTSTTNSLDDPRSFVGAVPVRSKQSLWPCKLQQTSARFLGTAVFARHARGSSPQRVSECLVYSSA
jgi:hypothetical protein